MKKILLFTLLQSLLSVAFSQSKPYIYLSRYTFSLNQQKIGFVKISSEIDIISTKIKGPNAVFFKISKDNQLSIRSNTIDPETKWLNITLIVKTSSGELIESFRLVNDHFIHNKVIAHRGAWKHTGAAENSIAALKNAIALGCEGSEFDVHLSADSILFINHNADVQGDTIEKSTAIKLSQLKLSNGESLPTLQSYISEGMKQNKTKLILEIKPSVISKERSITLTHKVLEMVKNIKAQA